jgi:hypothetical protein
MSNPSTSLRVRPERSRRTKSLPAGSQAFVFPKKKIGKFYGWRGEALRAAGELSAYGMGLPTCFEVVLRYPYSLLYIVNPVRSRQGPKGRIATGPVKFIESGLKEAREMQI